MARSTTDISLCHDVRLEEDEIIVAGMRGGYHFDVVFGSAVAFEASETILAFLKEVIDRMKSENPETQAANVFSLATISGDWRKQVRSQGDTILEERLRLHADGWSYKDFDGVAKEFGTLKKSDVNIA